MLLWACVAKRGNLKQKQATGVSRVLLVIVTELCLHVSICCTRSGTISAMSCAERLRLIGVLGWKSGPAYILTPTALWPLFPVCLHGS